MNMTFLVPGATGATGRQVVEQLLHRGLHVKAVVREYMGRPDARDIQQAVIDRGENAIPTRFADAKKPHRKDDYMSQLYVVRHGQTDWNAEGRYQGATDIALNETGRRQAKEVAVHIEKRYRIDSIVSSPLMRARQTAEIIAAMLGHDVLTMKQFKERDVGAFEGLTWEEAQTCYPEIWAQNITRQLNTSPPGGETILEVGARVLEGLDRLRTRFPGKNILLVAHGYIARLIFGILCRASDVQFNDYRLDNGEIASFTL